MNLGTLLNDLGLSNTPLNLGLDLGDLSNLNLGDLLGDLGLGDLANVTVEPFGGLTPYWWTSCRRRSSPRWACNGGAG